MPPGPLGAPTFVFANEPFFGQDRIDRTGRDRGNGKPDGKRQLRLVAAERSKHAFCEGHHAPHSGICRSRLC
jgi:hypothetical protein